MNQIEIFADGASRGNPGPSSFGVYCSSDGYRHGCVIADTTNNEAEYRGAIHALEYAVRRGYTDVVLKLDSLLVVKHFHGAFRVRAEHLKPLLVSLKEIAQAIPHLRVEHVPRAQNKEADRAANQALDNRQFG